MNMKKKSFIGGALILGLAGIISKSIGFLFRVPLTNMIGEEGYGLYNFPYSVYATILAISVAGIPVAISKLVSERITLNRHAEAHRIFKSALILMAVVGAAVSLLLFFSAELMVSTIWPEKAYYPLMGLVLAPLFVSLMAVFRGYFQGMQMMSATALSQIFEGLGRLIFGLGLAYLLIDRGVEYAAGGGSFGATAGAALGLIIITIIYFKQRPSIHQTIAHSEGQNSDNATLSYIKQVLLLSIPMSIGSVAGTLMPLIDSLMIQPRLLLAGFDESTATSLFGRIGASGTLINFSLTISLAIAISLVPAISEANALGDRLAVRKRLETAIRMAMFIVIPASIGMFILAKPILNLIFPSIQDAQVILQFLSIALVFITLNQVFTASIQGMGKYYIPVVFLLLGVIFKVAISYILTAMPAINVLGAVSGTIVGYFVAAALNFLYVRNLVDLKLNWLHTAIIPLISGALMGTAVYFVSRFLLVRTHHAVATLLSVAVGVLVYGICILLWGQIDEVPIRDTAFKMLKRFKERF